MQNICLPILLAAHIMHVSHVTTRTLVTIALLALLHNVQGSKHIDQEEYDVVAVGAEAMYSDRQFSGGAISFAYSYSIAYCLLPIACCLLPIAYCLLLAPGGGRKANEIRRKPAAAKEAAGASGFRNGYRLLRNGAVCA
jgi:hypothetical protein